MPFNCTIGSWGTGSLPRTKLLLCCVVCVKLSFLATKCNRLFRFQNWNEKYHTLISYARQGRRSHRIIGKGNKRRLGVWGTEVPSEVQGWSPVQGLGDLWTKSPSGVQGRSPGRGSGGRTQKLKLFCETTHNVCIKIQQRTVAVTRVDILNDITSKILGGHYHGCPPS